MEATTTATTAVVPGSTTPARSDWRRTWVVVGVLLIVACGAFVLTRGATMIYYLVLSWFLALAMEPAVSRLTRWMPRALATTTVLVGLVLGFFGFFWAFGSLLVDQLSQLVAAVPGDGRRRPRQAQRRHRLAVHGRPARRERWHHPR